MPFNAMWGGLPWQFFPWQLATYPLLRLGFEPRTQVSKTHVLAVYTNRADSIRVPYL